MQVNFLANIHRADALDSAERASRWLVQRGVTVKADRETAPRIGVDPVQNEEFCNADLAVTFGGDGTLIRAAHLCADVGTPILGVYYGRFGFVTQCTGDELESCLEQFLDGKARIEPRMMIQADLVRSENKIASVHSLNEIVVQRSATDRMLTFDVSADGHRLTSYPADGVIVSTPTGSTAYNLSAGGPVMDPVLQALVLTAIAPHTLSARTLVLGPDSRIDIRLQSDGDAVVSADGQTRLHLISGDEVQVTRSPKVTHLMRVEKNDFLIKLSEKLFWSQGMVDSH